MESKAKRLGATKFGSSRAKGKRFYVIYGGRRINFGLRGGSTFIDHRDEKKRRAWRARHSKIKMKDGSLAYKKKTQPSFWSWNLLW